MSSSEYLTVDALESSKNRTRSLKGLAVVSLMLHLTACSAEEDPKQLPERNAPASAEYTLDTNESFRSDVDAMLENENEPTIIDRLQILQQTPVSEWLYEDSEITDKALSDTLNKAQETATIPKIVLYNILGRDSGNHSDGGVATSDAYIDWATSVSAAIAQQPAIVVVEPDALTLTNSMGAPEKTDRIRTLGTTLDILHENKNTAVYFDAGNSSWLTPDVTARLISEVDKVSITGVVGISLNVSNYQSEEDTRDYADAVMEALGKDVYVLIDNSRNGAADQVEAGDWCNPVGQKLGEIDLLFDAREAVELAFIKTPGQSDGECGISQKPAGEFDSQLLLEQMR